MTEAGCDLRQMSNRFAQSIDGDDINLENYCAGYTEITKLVKS